MTTLTRDEGLFLDNTVTRTRWRATWRRTRMVVYRWLPALSSDEPSPEETLNNICERLTAGLKAAGIKAIRQSEQAIHRWLVRWFNPAPPVEDKNPSGDNWIYRKQNPCPSSPILLNAC